MLTDVQLDQLTSYLLTLERWNRTINLTSLLLPSFPPPTIHRLIEEPLRGSALVSQRHGRWFDFGSGSGSPAIPIAVVLPSLDLVMVESRGRKAAFLREAARAAGLSSASVLADRIAAVGAGGALGGAALISLRAVKIDREVSSAIDSLLSTSGEVLLFGTADWSLLAPAFEVARTEGSAVVLRRSVPRGTNSSRG